MREEYEGYESAAFYGHQPEFPRGPNETHHGAHPYFHRWIFYANGGQNQHRPAWEDVILTRVDSWLGNKHERSARTQFWRDVHAQQIRGQRARDRKAAALRAVRVGPRRRATKEARHAAARHRRRTRQQEVSSWHAPRTAEGYPEGYQPREDKEGDS